MASLAITGLYAGLLALLFIVLSINVIRLRLTYKVGIGIGDSEQKMLAKKVRIHGNFAEYIPLSLILLAIAEINGTSAAILHSFGALLFVGRLLHSVGLTKSLGTSRERQFGTLATFIVLLSLSVINIQTFVL